MGKYKEATKIIDENTHELNPFVFRNTNQFEKDIYQIYNIILAREVAEKFPKENQITFIDVLFNATLPVAKKF